MVLLIIIVQLFVLGSLLMTSTSAMLAATVSGSIPIASALSLVSSTAGFSARLVIILLISIEGQASFVLSGGFFLPLIIQQVIVGFRQHVWVSVCTSHVLVGNVLDKSSISVLVTVYQEENPQPRYQSFASQYAGSLSFIVGRIIKVGGDVFELCVELIRLALLRHSASAVWTSSLNFFHNRHYPAGYSD